MGLRRCAKKAQDEWRKTKKNAETPLPRNAEAFQGKGIVLPWGRCVLAERKGLEPSASGVTGRRYNRLNYRSGWWAVQDLNLWPPPCEGGALPAELTALVARLVLRKHPPFVKQKSLKRGIFFEKNYNAL